MSASSSPRETIQISLGPSANAVTAHLLNLQGLAATTASEAAYCDPLTTHFVEQKTWVPRVLMIDQATPTVSATETASPTSAAAFLENQSSLLVPWQGSMQVLGDANNSTHDNNPLWKTAHSLAYSPYSRYHASSSESSSMQHQSQYRANADNPRHVVWDDNDEESEEAHRRQQEAQDYAHRRQEQEREEWNAQTAPSLRNEMEQLMDKTYFSHSDTENPTAKDDPTTNLQWTDFWMPPFAQQSKVVLPYSNQSQLVPHWNVAYSTNTSSSSCLPFLQDWKEDVLLERLRHLLEPCDFGIQGAILTTEGYGMYASLAGMLLQELQEECKSASRWVNHVVVGENDNNDNSSNNATDGDVSWQEFQVSRVRQSISAGLALYDFTEKAHAVLPLRLDANTSLFRSSAQIAMALEACGLPFRLRDDEQRGRENAGRYKIGLQNAPFLGQGGSDTAWGSTASRISMAEYLAMLQPSSRYSMLEMDVLSQDVADSTGDNSSLYDAIRQGTSVESDQRMRQRGEMGLRGRPRDTVPGSWLQDVHQVGGGRGLLSSLSYSTKESQTMDLNRSVHHHFALSTAIRSQLIAPTRNNDGITMRDYLTCLVQGMGIRYRPERSMATLLDQTLGNLTFAKSGDGSLYGAGLYWKHLLPSVEATVVAVLGNTTRAFGSLDRIATGMKSTIRSSKFHGYVTRDVMNGVLPETDDCEEALEGCWDKRDLYHPPEGNGFDAEDDLDF